MPERLLQGLFMVAAGLLCLGVALGCRKGKKLTLPFVSVPVTNSFRVTCGTLGLVLIVIGVTSPFTHPGREETQDPVPPVVRPDSRHAERTSPESAQMPEQEPIERDKSEGISGTPDVRPKIADKALPLPYADLDKCYYPSGWMGPSTKESKLPREEIRKELESSLRFRSDCTDRPFKDSTCHQITYRADAKYDWVAVAWQYPENNWGDSPGWDASRFRRLVFHGRAEGQLTGDIKFMVGGHTREKAPFPASCGPVDLWVRPATDWTRYTIDLKGRDLSNLPIAFVFLVRREDHPNGCTFYLDDMHFEE